MDVLAGVVCGLLVGTVFLWAAIYLLATKQNAYARLARRLPEGLSPTAIILFTLAALPPATASVGAIAGLLYTLAEDSVPGSGIGSPNLVFTLGILSLSALVGLGLLLTRAPFARLGLAISAVFAGIFGWVLPLLAEWR